MPAQPAEVFRKNLDRVRHERGLTMEQLADICDTKRPNISRILSGNEGVSLDRAGRIAKALGLDICDLLAEPKRILEKIA